MTLPAQSLPDAAEPEQAPPDTPKRELPFPLTLFAVIGVSALVIILCILGGVVSGVFGLIGGADEARPATSPTLSFVPPQRPPADSFDDGQWVVGVDIVPGTYSTTVPIDSSGCAWEHASSGDSTVNSLIETGTANDNEKIILTLTEADHVVRSDGCGVWHRS